MPSHRWMRVCCALISGIVVLALGSSPLATAGTAACDRALSYFRSSSRGIEWRVYDPASRTDTLFLTVEGIPSEMVWDTSLARVDFFIGRTLHRARWRAGSRDRILARFPEKPEACFWWFNPDSACWQFATKRVDLHIPDRQDPRFPACQSELWQSSRDGQRWRFILSDTTVSDMDDCGLSEGITSLIRNEPKVTPEDFAPPLSESSREDAHSFPGHSMPDSTGWDALYVPLTSVPVMGIEMFYFSGSTEWSVAGPAWLVNSSTGSRRVLCGPPSGPYNYLEHCTLMITEACGLLLVYYCGAPVQVVDARTGRYSKCLPKNATAVFVAPRLRR